MWSWLIPLFFFAAPLGSPVPGFLVFGLLGLVHAWQSWKGVQHRNSFVWSHEDSVLAACFMSIPLFKLMTLLWSPDPVLALGNVAWHLYLLFWPLVLLGLAWCNGRTMTQERVDQALAGGLIVTALLGLYWYQFKGIPDLRLLGNVGISAQLLMVLGSWNLLALSRPQAMSPAQRMLLGTAFVCTWIALVLTTRRLELLGFAVLCALIVLYRLWRRLSPTRLALLALLFLCVAAWVLSLRWEKFVLGWVEIQHYLDRRASGAAYVDSSWGARLEMWRLGWLGFIEHPWLGMSASARPYDMPDAPPHAVFGHRHFHSHWVQTAVEGGVLGLAVLTMALWHSTRRLILEVWHRQKETALLGAALLGAYALEGAASATLVYDKPNALLVVATAWLWLQLRTKPLSATP